MDYRLASFHLEASQGDFGLLKVSLVLSSSSGHGLSSLIHSCEVTLFLSHNGGVVGGR